MTLSYSVFWMGRGVSAGHECGFSAAHKVYFGYVCSCDTQTFCNSNFLHMHHQIGHKLNFLSLGAFAEAAVSLCHGLQILPECSLTKEYTDYTYSLTDTMLSLQGTAILTDYLI